MDDRQLNDQVNLLIEHIKQNSDTFCTVLTKMDPIKPTKEVTEHNIRMGLEVLINTGKITIN